MRLLFVRRRALSTTRQRAGHLLLANAIRLDAYDGPPGDGAFYEKCGFTKTGHAVYRSVPLVYYEFVF